ncbi:MAG: hypothetical protein EXS39_04350 [Opitutaceae bacterium]|nr:hypothetical protein [Opitutaceae bacterium]
MKINLSLRILAPVAMGCGLFLTVPDSFAVDAAAKSSPALAPATAVVTASSDKVLFAFDDRALPFQQALRLQLTSFRKKGSPSNVVVPLGPPGAPDSKGIFYCISVLEMNGEFWMWYIGAGDHDVSKSGIVYGLPFRLCFARSKDGVHWEKPSLGLLEYAGNRKNNLVELDGREFELQEGVILYEPDEADANRRFKIVFEASKYKLRFAVATSADGVRWKESPNNPRGPWLEPSGLIKWHGAYYVNGQGNGHWIPGVARATRVLGSYISHDFEHWTQIPALGFRRDPLPPRPVNLTGWNDGEQVHLGASLWKRGDVIIGFYGQWHGHPSNDRRFVTMDLGLVISHDALHYYEPVPDFRIIEGAEVARALPLTRAPSLAQSQGFANIGDQTLTWYTAWGVPEDGIRLATAERDRLGFLQPSPVQGFQDGTNYPPCLISAPVATGGKPVTISVNASGLSDLSQLKVSVLDEQFRELPGFGAADWTGPKESGFSQRATWGQRNIVSAGGPIRIRVDFSGVRPEDLKLYAIYVTPVP